MITIRVSGGDDQQRELLQKAISSMCETFACAQVLADGHPDWSPEDFYQALIRLWRVTSPVDVTTVSGSVQLEAMENG